MRRCILIHGDTRLSLAALRDDSIDAVVGDPPYELGFMGKAWDGSGVANDVVMWREVLRVLKPGGHLVAFGGTRTYHRMACAIEDAGFEIRDTLAWMYGSGFPKSMDVSKAIGGMHRGALNVEPDSTGSHIWSGEQTSNEAVTDAAKQWEGWGTALKPAYEPIVLARKPIKGTVAANVLTHGTGALNIDATRIAATDADEGRVRHGGGTNGVYAQDDWTKANQATMGSQMPAGRWPANVLLNHHEDCVALGTREVKSHNPDNKTLVGDDTTVHAYGKYQTRSPVGHAVDGKETIEVWECVDACPVRMLDAQSGVRRSSGVYPGDGVLFSDGDGGDVVRAGRDRHRPNAGGASRFFYNGKVSKRERNAGMPEGEINDHATVKPIEVMQWLITLITPPGGRVLDPFLGSGTTAVAAAVLGFEMVGVELSAHHLDIAGHRVRHVGVDPVRIIGLGGLS